MNSLSVEKRTKKSRQLSTFPLKSSIIDVRELDFRVRNGNGYCLSTMATGILLPILIRSFIRKTVNGAQIKLWNGIFQGKIMNGNNNMVKPHDLLVMLG